MGLSLRVIFPLNVSAGRVAFGQRGDLLSRVAKQVAGSAPIGAGRGAGRGRIHRVSGGVPHLRAAVDTGEPHSHLRQLLGFICVTCGRPLEAYPLREGEVLLCPACKTGQYEFDRARSYAIYEGALIRAIVLLKFEEMTPLGHWFGERLAELVRRGEEELAADVVVPVPLHRQRQRERGYNQADLIARPLARRLGLPCRPVLLVRTKPRPDKLHLSLEERWSSVRGAFAAKPGSRVDNLRVLLVDDVMTTGATLDACARALRQAGARTVIGLTVARALGNPLPAADER